MTLTPSGGSTAVSEDGSTVTDSYTVVLDTAPSADVTVTVTAGTGVQVNKPSGAAGASQTLTFTAGGDGSGSGQGNGNWAVAQTITVTGVDDGTDTAPRSVTIDHAASSSDTAYTIASAGSVSVTVSDDDPTEVSLARASGNTGSLTEGGSGKVEFTVTLGRALVAGERIDVPLSIAGSGIATTDFTLGEKSGSSLNTGVSILSGTTLSPTISFAGVGAETATLEISADTDSVDEGTGETLSVSLDTNTVFDADTDTNVGGGADPSATTRTFSFDIEEPTPLPVVSVTKPTIEGVSRNAAGQQVREESTESATFEVTLSEDPQGFFYVCVRVTETGEDRVGSTNEGIIQTAVIGEVSRIIVSWTSDTDDEADSVVTFEAIDPSTQGCSVAAGTYTVHATNDSDAALIRDDDATVVELDEADATITEGGTVEFEVELGRALAAGEVIDVPLSISGTDVTTGDWSLAKKSGSSLNKGVGLSGETTATPKLTFTGHATDVVQTATLELTATVDNTAETGGSETFTVALGPDGTGTNGFDVTTLGTNVGGGANPHGTNKDFDLTVNDPAPPVLPGGAALVSNIGQANRNAGSAFLSDMAQAFTTGGNSTGYTLTSVDVLFQAHSGSNFSFLTASIRANNNGQPGSAVGTLTNPAQQQFSSDRVLTFSATGDGFDLDPNTTYFLVLDSSASTATTSIRVTTSDNEDADKATGWSIANGSFFRAYNATTWTSSNSKRKIRIKGSAKATSTSAGVTLTPSGGSTAVSEDGSTVTDSYTVVLDTAPSADVTVTVTAGTGVQVNKPSGNAGASQTLTFTAGGDGSGSGQGNGNWAVAQTITVTGVDDGTDTAPRRVTIDHAASSSDTAYTIASAGSVSVTVSDDDPTVVELDEADATITEGGTVEFEVELGRALAAGEVIDVPLSISGTDVTTGDWSLAKKSGSSLNKGVGLSGETTATPKLTFTGHATDVVQTATLELTATVDNTAETGGSETFTVALGPDGTGTNGFDVTTLGTNVGGGANPHGTNKDFDLTVNDPAPTIPTITISRATTSPVDEGDPVDFTVSASPAPAANLTVKLTVADVSGSDFVASAGEGDQMVTIAATETTATYTVNTVSDTKAELDGDVTVSVAAATDSSYTVGTTSSATVTVESDDTAEMTITAGGTTIVEGGSQTLTITLDHTPDSNIFLGNPGNIHPGGRQIRGTTNTVTTDKLAPGISIVVHYDCDAHNDGSCLEGLADDVPNRQETFDLSTASVLSDDDLGPLVELGDPSTVTLTFIDNDPTEVSLARASGNTGNLTEGGSGKVEFTVTLSRALVAGERIDVPLSIAGSGIATTDFTLGEKSGQSLNTGVSILSGTTLSPTISFAGVGAETATLEISADTDSVDEGTGETLSVSLDTNTVFDADTDTNVGGGADPSTTTRTFSFDINDGDNTALTVPDATATVTEGGTLTVTFTGDPGQNSNIGSFVIASSPASAAVAATCGAGIDVLVAGPAGTLSGGTSSQTLSAAFTCNDTEVESDETFEVWWSSNPGVFDASAPNCRPTGFCTTIVTIEDTATPVLSVGAKAVEGRSRNAADELVYPEDSVSATFTASLTPAPAANFDVCVRVTETGEDRVGSTNEGIRTLTIPTASTSASNHDFTVPWTDTATDEADSVVTVEAVDPSTQGCSVAAGTYRVSGADGDDAVRIEDNEATVVELDEADATITEGGTVEFEVELGRALAVGEVIDVPLDISGTNVTTGDWSLAKKSGSSLNKGVGLSGETTATPKLTFTGHATDVVQTATLELTASGDNTAEGGGSGSETFTVALGPDGTGANGFDSFSGTTVGGGANPHGTNKDFDLTVNDAIVPVITIASDASSVTEGTGAGFTVTATPAPAADITVNLTVADDDTSDFVAGADEGMKEVTIGTSGTATYRVATVNGGTDADEPNGAVSVTVAANAGVYTVSPTERTASVDVEDDDATVVSLARASGNTGNLTEGGSGKVEFTVTLSRALVAGERIDVPLSIAGTGIATTDFTLGEKSGSSLNTGVLILRRSSLLPTIRFAGVGAETATLEISALQDNTADDAETLSVSLDTNTAFDADTDTNVGGGADPSTTTRTFSFDINDGDNTALTVPDATATVTEGGTLTVTFTGDPGQNSNIGSFVIASSPASAAVAATCGAGIDVLVAGPAGTLSGGTSSQTLSAAFTCNDTEVESDETFEVWWSSNPGVFDASAPNCRPTGFCTTIVTIEDTATPVLSVGAKAVEGRSRNAADELVYPEDSVSATFTASLTPAPAANFDVCVRVTETGEDRVGSTNEGIRTLTIPTASTSASNHDFTVPWTDTATDEADSVVTVEAVDPSTQGCSVAAGTYRVSGADGDDAVRIEDNEATVVELDEADATITEGGTVEFEVELGRALAVGEVIDVPLDISGTNVTTGDWSLAKKSGSSLNKGVGLSGETTATPKLTFTGHATDVVQTATLELTASGDNTAEGGGSGSETFTVALGPDGTGANGFDSFSGTTVGGGANPHGTNKDFDLTVNDAIVPVITIASDASSVTEGTGAGFTVTATPAPAADITVNLTVADDDTSDFVATGNEGGKTVTIGTSGTATYRVATVNGGTDADEPNGAVSVTVAANAGVYTVSPTERTASVDVEDDDATVVSLARVGTGAVSEGGSGKVEFTVTLSRALVAGERIDVPLSIAGTGIATTDFTLGEKSGSSLNTGVLILRRSSLLPTIRFAGVGAETATLEISALQDNTADDAETLSVSLDTNTAFDADTDTNVGGGADPSPTARTFSFDIEEPAEQVLDLSFRTTSIHEGGSNAVVFTATGASSTLVVPGGTSLLAFTGSATPGTDFTITAATNLVLTAPDYSSNPGFNATADNNDEPNETVTVSLQNLPNGFRAGTTASTVIIDQNPTSVTLSGGGTVMEDGSNSVDVTITLGRNLVESETVTVPLAIAGTGITGTDYTIELKPGNTLNTGVTLNTSAPHSAAAPAVVFAGHGTKSVQVATLRVTAGQDAANEGTSETLTVGFGSDTRAVTSNLDTDLAVTEDGTTPTGSASVTITDDDGVSNTAPTVANAIADQTATAGTGFSFAFAANTFEDGDNDALSYTATRGDGSALPAWLGFTANTRAFSGTPAADDTGTVTVRVTADDGNGGTVFEEFDIVVSVVVPEISITGGTGVTEGGTARFTITATPAPLADITVNLTVADDDTSDFVAPGDEGGKTVIIGTSGTATHTVATVNGGTDADEADGAVSVTVAANAGVYTVSSTAATATVDVTDDDATVVSLARVGSGAVNEGDTVEFTVTLSRALAGGEVIDVPLSIGGTGVDIRDWDLAEKAGDNLNTGVSLSGTTTTTPKLTFSGVAAEVATLELEASPDNTAEGGGSGSETFTVALGPDGTGTNGFDVTTLDTTVGGGADPGSGNSFTVVVNDFEFVLVSFAAGSSNVLEGGNAVLEAFVQSGTVPAGGISIPIMVNGGEAQPTDASSADYGTVPASIEIGADGLGSAELAITDDDLDELREIVRFSVGQLPQGVRLSGGVFDTADSRVLILDTDPTPVNLTGGGTITEEDTSSTVTMTVRLSRALTEDPLNSGTMEAATVPLQLASSTGAVLPGTADPHFTVSATGTGVVLTGAATATPTLTFTGDADMTVQEAEVTFTATANGDTDTTPETVTVTFGTLTSSQVEGRIEAGSSTSGTLTIADDDDRPEISITGGTAVTEGGTARFTITATPAPLADITVKLEVADDATSDFVAPGDEGDKTVTIGTSGTATHTVATVNGGTDADEADGAVSVTVAANAGVYTVSSTAATATVEVTDDDATPVELGTPDRIATEGDASDTASLTLTLGRALEAGEVLSVPLAFAGGTVGTEFTLALSGSPRGVGFNAGTSTVTFTGGDPVSATVATVLVTAPQDDDAVAETVTVSIPTGSTGNAPVLTATGLGGGASGSRVGNGEITLAEDDTAGLVFSPTSVTVGEGASGTYTVKLATQPTDTVTVSIGSNNADVTVDTNSVTNGPQTTLSFTTTTWNVAQTVTVAAAADDGTDNEAATLSHTASGGDYGAVTGSVDVTVNDDDTAGVRLSKATLAVAEGGSETYTVVLNTLPSADVTVTVTSGTPGKATVNRSGGTAGASQTLTFTTTTWNEAQVVTVAGVEDADLADETVSISHSASSSDTGYNSIAIDPVEVTVNDDDLPEISVTGGTGVTEGGTARFTITATPAPLADITVNLEVADDATSDFVAPGDEGDKTVTIGTSGTATHTVATVNGGTDADEADGAVSVTVAANAGVYTVSSTAATATVEVTDDDATPVELGTPDRIATEGDASDTASLTLTLGRALEAGEVLSVPLAFAGGTVGTEFTLALSGSPRGVGFNAGTSTVTFTGGDPVSATVATVLVTAPQDDDAVAETVTVSIPTGSTGNAPVLTATGLGGGASGSRVGNGEITLAEDDTAGLVFSPTSVTVGEGASGTYTVKLATQPTDTVTVSIGSNNADVTVDTDSVTNGPQTTLSFTTTTWNVAQTVTVAAAADDGTDNEAATLSHTASGGDYGAVTGSVDVTVNDDDTAGVRLSKATLAVAEGGSETYTVVLNTLPSADVTVTVTSGTPGKATVNRSGGTAGASQTLTFTTTTWNEAQVVTVAGVEDADLADETVSISHSASSSDTGYNSIAIDPVEVTVNDDDLPEISVTGGTGVTEGGTARFTITATPAPLADITVNLEVADDATSDFVATGNEGDKTVTIGTSGTATHTVATVNGGTDADEADGAVSVTVAANAGVYTVSSTAATATVEVTDDDATPVELGTPDRIATEGDASDTASLTLTLGRALEAGEVLSVPLAFAGGTVGTEFTLALSGSPRGVGFNAGTSTVTFTGGDPVSATVATVLVTAPQDDDAVAETVTVSIPTGSTGNAPVLTATGLGGGASGSRVGNGEITLAEDDTAGLVFSPTSVTVGEGASGTYTVKLATQPTDTVTVSIGSNNADVTVDTDSVTNGPQTTLSFTTTTWNVAQTVTVAAAADDGTDNEAATLSHTASGGDYGAVTGSVDVTVNDDDTAGVRLSKATLAVAEGGSETYTVVLNTLPSADVTVTVTSGTPGKATVNRSGGTAGASQTLTFTTTTWNEAQVVTVAGVEDADLADETVSISHSASSSDTGYNSIAIDPVEVTVNDDDLPEISVTGGTGVTEGGTARFTITATPAPLADITVNLEVADDATSDFVATGNEGDKTVTIGTSGTATHEVATQDDATDEPDGQVTVTVLSDADDLATYSTGAAPGNRATVAVADDDIAGITLTESGDPAGTTVSEDGGTDSYTVVLNSAPTEDVTVTVTSDRPGKATVNRSGGTAGASQTLIFTTTTWNEAQVVTVAGVEDADLADETVSISHSASSGDAGYNSIAIDPVEVTVNDGDLPEISIAGGTGVTEGEGARFTITATPAPLADITVSLSVADDATSDFVAPDDEGGKTVIILAGETTATYTVATQDDDTDEPDGGVTVTVLSDADDPATYSTRAAPGNRATVAVADDDIAGITLTESGDPAGTTVSEDGGTDSYTVVLNSAPTEDVTVTVTSDRPGNATVNRSGGIAGASQTLIFTASDWNAPQTITVTGVNDDIDNAGDERRATITHAARSGDPRYQDLTIAPVEVTVADDDTRNTLDAAAEAGLTRFGRTVGEQSVSAVRDRLSASRRSGFTGSFAGQALPSLDWSGDRGAAGAGGGDEPPVAGAGQDNAPEDAGLARSGTGDGTSGRSVAAVPGASGDAVTALRSWLAGPEDAAGDGAGDEVDVRALDTADILPGTSFTLTRETEAGGSLALWGRGAVSGFSGREGDVDLDGDVRSLMLGSDWSREDWTYGLMLSRSHGDIGYRGGAAPGGEIETELTALVPYVGWDVNDRLSAWGTFGFGQGEMRLRPDGGASVRTDIDWQMAAAGLEGALSPDRGLAGARLSWTADALWTRTGSDAVPGLRSLSGETTRLRLGLEGSWERRLASGGALSPRLEMGLRHDGGDAETGFGLEIGGGLDWTDPTRGLLLGLSGRTLALHEDGSFGDWGVSAVLEYDPTPETKRGFAARLSHDLGGTSSGGMQALLGPDSFPGLNETAGGGNWALEAAYGVSRGRGRVGSSYMALSGTEAAEAARLGYRLEPDAPHAGDVSLDFWTEPAVQGSAETGDTNHSLGMDLNWQW